MLNSFMFEVTPYAAAIAGLIATLVLFVSVKREVHENARRERRNFEQLLAATPAPAPVPEPVYIPVQLRPGININRRVHALRMLRRGENVPHIAAALGVPRREVELLVRVAQLSRNTPRAADAA
jgi:hypothetical protein